MHTRACARACTRVRVHARTHTHTRIATYLHPFVRVSHFKPITSVRTRPTTGATNNPERPLLLFALSQKTTGTVQSLSPPLSTIVITCGVSVAAIVLGLRVTVPFPLPSDDPAEDVEVHGDTDMLIGT